MECRKAHYFGVGSYTGVGIGVTNKQVVCRDNILYPGVRQVTIFPPLSYPPCPDCRVLSGPQGGVSNQTLPADDFLKYSASTKWFAITIL
ncbi:hypothetical protein J6590_007196 [Homalodisca vitripennis]|nr:hypothetical protein J6590_007196 [Homalodisca vitripennis]